MGTVNKEERTTQISSTKDSTTRSRWDLRSLQEGLPPSNSVFNSVNNCISCYSRTSSIILIRPDPHILFTCIFLSPYKIQHFCSHRFFHGKHMLHFTVQACHRSCAQKVIMEMCKCGDPMFPIPNINGMKACHATNAEERECLRNATLYLGEVYSKEKEGVPGCYCHQPCE